MNQTTQVILLFLVGTTTLSSVQNSKTPMTSSIFVVFLVVLGWVSIHWGGK